MSARPITIVMAEDDPDDREFTREAWDDNGLTDNLRFVEDGEELMEYLRRSGKYTDPTFSPRPDLILLDLNMPRKDGREALAEIKADPELRRIPVVVLTTSSAEHDVTRTYDLGVNSYITKPVSFEGLVSTIRTLGEYWFQTVQLPPKND